jgi:type IV fimbrial biogenesis protein FimT
MRAPGFTLIELLIAMSILAILVLFAAPMYSQFIANHNVRNAAEAMLDGLRTAQTQALKNNLPALFVVTAGGWTITIDDPDNVGTPLYKEDYALSEGARMATLAASPGGASSVTFDGLGRVVANADATATLQTLDVTNPSVAGSRPLRVIVSNAASGVGTRVCDPAPPAFDPVTRPEGCP